MSDKLVRGVFAAVITPRRPDGSLDEASFECLLAFLIDHQVKGVVVNGATGEYCLNSVDEVATLTRLAVTAAAGRVRVLSGVGAPGLSGAVANGVAALRAGADGLLLPAPHFFPFSQDDVTAFFCDAAARLPAPILLYNIPQFTTGMTLHTVARVMDACPNVVGVKDSSGSLDLLRDMTCDAPSSCRVVGNDGVLVRAMEQQVLDGVISGVACVLPELIVRLFAGEDSASRLDEFIAAISPFPVPWALKWIAESRGLAPVWFAQPVSATRAAEACELQRWFTAWVQESY
jgi:4-hydroxy-tetrahydrodipicolinate synthase